MKGLTSATKKALRWLAVIAPLAALLGLASPVLAAPELAISPASGAIGTEITISGTLFESYRDDSIEIFFDDTEIDGSPLIVPQTGSFNISFTIPGNTKAGKHWVEIRDESGKELAENFFTVEEATLTPGVFSGPTGTVVTVQGEGFHANTMVTLYYYNRTKEKLGTEIADTTGEFSYHFTVPISTAGNHLILAENAEDASAETQFEVVPTLSIDMDSAAPDDVLTASGTGFDYRSDTIIYIGNDEVAFTRTDVYGSFDVSFDVPVLTSGAYEIKAEDEDGNIDRTKFTVTAGASISTDTGSVGTEIIISGSGYEPGETLIIEYDSAQVATTKADITGSFTGTFEIPLSTSGSHVITVTGTNTTKELDFSVESVAPPAPILLLPSNATQTKAAVFLDWQDVTDESTPVTYTLQISTDHNFADIVLDKPALLASEYTLSGEEVLAAMGKQRPYYWRVKATDSATNEGEWATPSSFYITPPPIPSLITPAMNVKVETPVFLDWEEVTAFRPPVTYNLQIAADGEFTEIVLKKEALTESEYTLTEEEKLPAVKEEAPYYWRVKAIDNDANESEWSTPETFHVGFSFSLPGWGIGLLIALAAILVGFGTFIIGRRTAYTKEGY